MVNFVIAQTVPSVEKTVLFSADLPRCPAVPPVFTKNGYLFDLS